MSLEIKEFTPSPWWAYGVFIVAGLTAIGLAYFAMHVLNQGASVPLALVAIQIAFTTFPFQAASSAAERDQHDLRIWGMTLLSLTCLGAACYGMFETLKLLPNTAYWPAVFAICLYLTWVVWVLAYGGFIGRWLLSTKQE
ncbi:MAG: hypothetical protein Aurels2KO_25700 [Aureliella sp.]